MVSGRLGEVAHGRAATPSAALAVVLNLCTQACEGRDAIRAPDRNKLPHSVTTLPQFEQGGTPETRKTGAALEVELRVHPKSRSLL